jgi:hypothetical protein
VTQVLISPDHLARIGGPHRLGVGDGSAGLGPAARGGPDLLAQRIVQVIQGPVSAPGVDVAVHGALRRYSRGGYRQTQPVRITYKMASTITRREWTADRPRPPANGAGSSDPVAARSRSARSEGQRLPESSRVIWACAAPLLS